MADPDVYMPRFGGYDPVGVARGVAVPGDPRLWLIADERLYLFYSDGDAGGIQRATRDRTIEAAEPGMAGCASQAGAVIAELTLAG